MLLLHNTAKATSLQGIYPKPETGDMNSWLDQRATALSDALAAIHTALEALDAIGEVHAVVHLDIAIGILDEHIQAIAGTN